MNYPTPAPVDGLARWNAIDLLASTDAAATWIPKNNGTEVTPLWKWVRRKTGIVAGSGSGAYALAAAKLNALEAAVAESRLLKHYNIYDGTYTNAPESVYLLNDILPGNLQAVVSEYSLSAIYEVTFKDFRTYCWIVNGVFTEDLSQRIPNASKALIQTKTISLRHIKAPEVYEIPTAVANLSVNDFYPDAQVPVQYEDFYCWYEPTDSLEEPWVEITTARAPVYEEGQDAPWWPHDKAIIQRIFFYGTGDRANLITDIYYVYLLEGGDRTVDPKDKTLGALHWGLSGQYVGLWKHNGIMHLAKKGSVWRRSETDGTFRLLVDYIPENVQQIEDDMVNNPVYAQAS